jgi:hypothetical protein
MSPNLLERDERGQVENFVNAPAMYVVAASKNIWLSKCGHYFLHKKKQKQNLNANHEWSLVLKDFFAFC